MECVRLINWCIENIGGRLNEKWLLRVESDGSYREILSEVHRPLLNKSGSMSAAVNALSACHDRPIPYHAIDILISEEHGRIHSYWPKHNDWEDLGDISALANIAPEIRLVTVIVKEQEKSAGATLHQARCSALADRRFFTRETSKKPHDVAESLTYLTGVRPLRLVVNEKHCGTLETQSLSALETLEFLKDHASRTGQEKETLTVYRLHMNRNFALVALKVICAEILTEKQRTDSEPWWSETGYVFMPNSFFRFIFFTDGAQADVCPIERLFFEQYFTVPCETGGYNASCAENVTHVFSGMVSLAGGEQTIIDVAIRREASSLAGMMEREPVDASEGVSGEGKIAVFDYKMFYPYVMYVSAESPAYKRRVLHMATALSLVPGLKKVYVKELGMLGIVRKQLYDNMRALSLIILSSLIGACESTGLRVIFTQTDSVTVRVPPSVMQANGGSLEQLASVLQQIVRGQHPTFLSQLKVEREGTNMIVYNSNKHILYDGEQVVHRTGLDAKTFCPAMSRTIQEATRNKKQILQLLCSSSAQIDTSMEGYSTFLRTFVSDKLTEHAMTKRDLVCESYSLPMPLLTQILHVQPGEDGMFTTKPPLYLVLSQYRADNAITLPTIGAFMSSLLQTTDITSKHLDHENTKRVLGMVFTENMGMIRWRLVLEELIEHFVAKTVSFLAGGRLV